MLYKEPHNFINKLSGIKPEVRDYFRKGSDGHKIIQRHVAGIEQHPDLMHIKDEFPIVEKKAFDEDTHFEFEYENYIIHGYFDGLNPATKTMLEIKLSSTPWTQKQFQELMQRKVYSLSLIDYETAILITGSLNPEEWKNKKLKIREVKFTTKDRAEAMEWIRGGIEIFESGEYMSDLEKTDGICTNPRCLWGKNCQFKRGNI